jgi:hypothetical protein
MGPGNHKSGLEIIHRLFIAFDSFIFDGLCGAPGRAETQGKCVGVQFVGSD